MSDHVESGAPEPGAMRGGHDPAELGRRRWQLARSPDLRERAVAALQRIGRAGLRELRRVEAAGKAIPPHLLTGAARPWEALLDHATDQEQARFAREELEQARKLVARTQAMKRMAS